MAASITSTPIVERPGWYTAPPQPPGWVPTFAGPRFESEAVDLFLVESIRELAAEVRSLIRELAPSPILSPSAEDVARYGRPR